MFFVGATGQLITLLLTVCLPFVLLLSGKPQVDIRLTTETIIVCENRNEIPQFEISSSDFVADFISQKDNLYLNFEDIYTIQKIPPQRFLFNWEQICSTSSGNKAPPFSVSYSC